ncbi:MAG: NHL repeat-containing protein, partial [Phycisphaerales bacterium]|nr:NHL repeat-containing protein [Phycisphaerales bacterium]
MNILQMLALVLVASACRHADATLAAMASPPDATPFRFGAWTGDIDDLRDPSDVAIASDGTILVVDTDRNRVVRYRLENGKPVPSGAFGELGAAPGAFRYPRGIAVGLNGRILVADAGNDRVQIFDPDGGLLGGFGSRGREPGQFNNPTGVAVDATGICVADTGNDRVQLFDSEGKFLRSFGGPGGT